MLQIKNIFAKINEKIILKGVNLNIKHGEIHAVMGPNGSGKSTLSSIITGKEGYDIYKGTIYFENKNILSLSPDQRANLGIFLSFQYPVEIPGLSIINFINSSVNAIRKANSMKKISSSRILEKIYSKAKILGIEKSFLHRPINYGFSGGEKKKNEILQMLILEPKLTILDETDSGLDIDALKLISNSINYMKNDHNAIIIITHYNRILKYIKPDYVHIFYQGRIIETGDYKLADLIEKKGYNILK